MLYWYLADGRPALLAQMERMMDVALRRMQDPIKHRVCPVEDPSVHIAEVVVNGKAWTDYDAEKRTVNLPAGEGMKVRVVLTNVP